MTRDPSLAGLIRRFSKLSRKDRDYVLDMLGQAERETLHLILNENAGTMLSPTLANLVDGCRSDRRPTTLTERAARELIMAVDAATGSDSIDEALRRPLQRPGWKRLLRREAPTS